jgi:hypothetical protein
MQLRNGKQVTGKQVTGKQVTEKSETHLSFTDTVRNLLDGCINAFSPIEKINAMCKVFDTINNQSAGMLSEMGLGDTYKFLSTIYRKTVELTCVLIERTYLNEYYDTDKNAMIRLLSVMFQVRRTAAQILWTARTSKNVQDMMENGDRHSELLYRCLKHIVSDEAESCDYKFYLYEDGEYTDVELFDWYLLPNYCEDLSRDPYIMNADDCFGAEIRRFNSWLWS